VSFLKILYNSSLTVNILMLTYAKYLPQKFKGIHCPRIWQLWVSPRNSRFDVRWVLVLNG